MLKNYLKIALRSLWKNRVYTLINMLGLSVGMAACFLIWLYVEDEFSYDQFHSQKEQIYRLALERIYPDRRNSYAVTQAGYAKALKAEFPEIVNFVRVADNSNPDGTVLHYEDNYQTENKIIAVDSTFFNIFDFPLIKGDIKTVLLEPRAVVMTESTAKRYFKEENPIGKNILFGDTTSFVVKGICKDPPVNSSIQFTILFSNKFNPEQFDDKNFISFSVHTFILTKPNADIQMMEAKLPALVEKYASGAIQREWGVSYKEYVKSGNGYRFFFQKLTDIHLKSNLESELSNNGNLTYVQIFIVIGLFILVVACINFMNLATAQSAERAKEVGIRKVLGSFRQQLIWQFLTEATMVSLVSLILAFLWIELTIPAFNNLSGKSLGLTVLFEPLNIVKLLALMLGIGFLAGIYPAFVLSGFEPILVLKGKFKSSRKGQVLRNSLVVIQFAISVILIVATLAVYQQMSFLQNKNLGFDKENIALISKAFTLGNSQRLETFKQELRQFPEIQGVAGTQFTPNAFTFGFSFKAENAGVAKSEFKTIRGMIMDDDCVETLGLKILEGRDFDKKFQDSLSVILNETAVKALGLQNPVGKRITNSDSNPANVRTYKVIGVVKDFHFQSLHQKVLPLAIMSTQGIFNFSPFLAVRIQAGQTQKALQNIEKTWQKFNPKEPFKMGFLDNQINTLYKTEQTSMQVFGIFAGLAILIACVGLFGLIAYIAQNRKKEIGIRKVLGADISGILYLLSKEFIILVLIANALAIPIAYYSMSNWLQNFAYRTELNVFIFLIATFITLIIAFFTISFQALKVAGVNPIEVLKDE